jgi:proline racemase
LKSKHFLHAAGLISGSAGFYQGQSSVAYSVPVVTDATSYTWTYSGTGATITGTTNNVTITFAAMQLPETVRGINSCGGTVSANYDCSQPC